MSTGTRVPLAKARAIADDAVAQLRPRCSRIEIVGALKRGRPTIGDVEIVCLPKPFDATPLLPCGMRLDLFMPDPNGFGLQVAIRTGSADWCKHVLAPAWVRAGFHSKDGVLRHASGAVVPTPNERALFDLIGLRWTEPQDREVAR